MCLSVKQCNIYNIIFGYNLKYEEHLSGIHSSHLFSFLIYLCIHILDYSCLFKATNIDFTKHLHPSMQIMSQLASESCLNHQNIRADNPKSEPSEKEDSL